MNERALDCLLAHEHEIREYDGAELHQPVVVKVDTWRPRLTGWAPGLQVLHDHVSEAESTRPTAEFNRSELPVLAEAAIGGDSDDVLRLLATCHVWGSGRTNGRGPRYLEAALVDPERTVSRLRKTIELVDRGRAGRAYQISHHRISGVGRAFLSKFLYATALGIDRDQPPALILDTRVWEGLGALGWDSLQAAGTRRWDERYKAYVSQMYRWADQIDCRADSLERLLFEHRSQVCDSCS